MKLKSLLGAGVFAFSLSAVASKPNLPKFEGNTDGIPSTENVPYSDEAYKKEISAAVSRSTRTVASSNDENVSNYEAAMSPELKKLRSEILAIRSSDDLDKKINALSVALESIDKSDAANGVTRDNRYKGADRDYRYYAAQIVPLQCLKGIVWKYTPLAETSGVVDSRLVSSVFRLSQSMQLMSPQVEDLIDPQAIRKAKENNEQNISFSVFDYLTKPYNGAVLFTSGYELQEHLMNYCYTALDKSAERIDRLDLSKRIVWDNKMYFGVGSFPDDLDRYKLLGEAERHFSLAMKNAGMHFISFFRAYSIKDYFKLQTELGKLYVQDAFPSLFTNSFREVDGVNIQKRANKIRSFPNTFILYKDGETYLSKAWDRLVRSIQELNLVWTEVKDKPENQRNVINPAFLNAFRRGTDQTLEAWNSVIKGPADLRSRLTARTVKFDLRSFYKHPVEDLKTLLPVQFDDSSSQFVENKFNTFVRDASFNRVRAPKRYTKYRNWYYGEATKWDESAWKKIFPELKSSEEIPQYLRTMNQAWGGSTMALPLMQFVR